jgi:hypothetical protein
MSDLQPPRQPCDGAVSVNLSPDDEVIVNVTPNGNEQAIVMSEYNAWRVFGMLALVLGVSLPRKIANSIKL